MLCRMHVYTCFFQAHVAHVLVLEYNSRSSNKLQCLPFERNDVFHS